MANPNESTPPRENSNPVQELLEEFYEEPLQMSREIEVREVKVGLKELIVGLLAIGMGALFLTTGYVAIKNHLEKKKYGYYIEKGGDALKAITQLITKLEGSTRG